MKKILIAVCLLILFSWQNNALDLMPYWPLGDVKVGGVFKRTDPKADYNFSISAFKYKFAVKRIVDMRLIKQFDGTDCGAACLAIIAFTSLAPCP